MVSTPDHDEWSAEDLENILDSTQQQNGIIQEETVDINYDDIPNCVESLVLSVNDLEFSDRLMISDDHDELTDTLKALI